VGTRIKNSVRCVKELDIIVEGVVFAPLAAAQVMLDLNQKNLGALVIDIGGGTTGYVVYVDGAIKQSRCLAVGGDHITNDISLGLRIPMARAERLKIEEGSVVLGESRPGDRVVLKDEAGFAGRELDREMLNTIIHCRVREIFELLKRDFEENNYLHFLGSGVLLTGGGSLIRGIDSLAEEIFGMPVHLTHPHTINGIHSPFENPQCSTAIGLIKYAQAMQGEKPRGWFSRFKRKLPFFGLF
jgi:cell division protein FtsA